MTWAWRVDGPGDRTGQECIGGESLIETAGEGDWHIGDDRERLFVGRLETVTPEVIDLEDLREMLEDGILTPERIRDLALDRLGDIQCDPEVEILAGGMEAWAALGEVIAPEEALAWAARWLYVSDHWEMVDEQEVCAVSLVGGEWVLGEREGATAVIKRLPSPGPVLWGWCAGETEGLEGGLSGAVYAVEQGLKTPGGVPW